MFRVRYIVLLLMISAGARLREWLVGSAVAQRGGVRGGVGGRAAVAGGAASSIHAAPAARRQARARARYATLAPD